MLTKPWPAGRRRRRRSPGRRRRPRSAAAAPSSSHTRTVTWRLGRVLGRVLQRLEAAEVDGRLDLGRVAADAVGVDARRRAGCGRRPRAAPRAGRCPSAAAGRCRGPGRAAPGSCPSRRRPSSSSISAAPLGVVRRPCRSARRRFTARATRCCWAPSWRLRSILRRSASPVATMRARDACSSSACGAARRGVACSAESSCTLCRARPTWRASSVSTRSSSSVKASPSRGPLEHDAGRAARPSGLIGATRSWWPAAPVEQRGQPHLDPGAAGHAGPGRRPAARSVARCAAAAAAGRAPTRPARSGRPLPVQISARRERHRLAQRLGQLQQQLVHRDGAGTAGCRTSAAPRRARAARRRRAGWRARSAARGPAGRASAATPAATIDSTRSVRSLVGRGAAEADHDDQVDARPPRRSSPVTETV